MGYILVADRKDQTLRVTGCSNRVSNSRLMAPRINVNGEPSQSIKIDPIKKGARGKRGRHTEFSNQVASKLPNSSVKVLVGCIQGGELEPVEN